MHDVLLVVLALAALGALVVLVVLTIKPKSGTAAVGVGFLAGNVLVDPRALHQWNT